MDYIVQSNSEIINKDAADFYDVLFERFKHIFIYTFDTAEFSPTFSLAALFDPTQAIFVDHSVYELKALISTAVETPNDENVFVNV